MLNHSMFKIVDTCGREILKFTREMEDEAEFFASANTYAAVRERLQIMADTLGNLPMELRIRLKAMDWNGWAALHRALTAGGEDRELVWYALRALVPASLFLLGELRRNEGDLFDFRRR